MRMNKIMMAVVLSLSGVHAVHANSGQLTFEGSVIDAPCSISADSVDQTIQMGLISNAALAKNTNTGESVPRSFSIKLEECTVSTAGIKDKVTVTFDGAPSTYDRESFGVNGDASGVYLLLSAGDGTKVKINTPTAADGFTDGSSPVLNFTARIKGGGSGATILPGAFSAPLTFKLAYQ